MNYLVNETMHIKFARTKLEQLWDRNAHTPAWKVVFPTGAGMFEHQLGPLQDLKNTVNGAGRRGQNNDYLENYLGNSTIQAAARNQMVAIKRRHDRPTAVG